jgi:hypothetical protein
VSINELLHCAETAVPYRIFRVFGIEGRKARMCISNPLMEFANSILPILEKLPAGVSADNISINPAKLSFGPAVELEIRPDAIE